MVVSMPCVTITDFHVLLLFSFSLLEKSVARPAGIYGSVSGRAKNGNNGVYSTTAVTWLNTA